jgi:hypothetical protein
VRRNLSFVPEHCNEVFDRFRVVLQFADGYDGRIPPTKEFSAMVSIRTGVVSDD